MLNKIIKVSSISGGLLIFCGVLKLIIYYSYFRINIVDFLNLQEIITSFLDDINILIIFGFIMMVVTFASVGILHKSTKIPMDKVPDELYKKIFPFRYWYVAFFFLAIMTLSLLLYYDIIILQYWIIYLLAFFTLQMITFAFLVKNENQEIDLPDFPMVISVAVSIVFAIFLFTRYDIRATANHTIAVRIYTNDATYVCNKETNNVFIGKTDGYVFVKINENNSTVSIPISEVKRFEFQ